MITNPNYRPEDYVELRKPTFLFSHCQAEDCGKVISSKEMYCKGCKKGEGNWTTNQKKL